MTRTTATMRLPYVLLFLAAASAVAVWFAGVPGCHADPDADRGTRHADSSRVAERVADAYAAQIDSLTWRIDRDAAIIVRLNERTHQAESVASEANAEADRLLAAYRQKQEKTTEEHGKTIEKQDSCSSALDACTAARAALSRVVDAQRAEIAALYADRNQYARLDSLRRGETAALRAALSEMTLAYDAMERAYEGEKAARLTLRRRLWFERAVLVAAGAGVAYLVR